MNRTEHLLTCLAEECGEVAKECHKALRFGLDDQLTLDPNGPRGTEGPTNREKIVDEVRDLLGVLHLLVKEGVLPDLGISATDPALQAHIERKKQRIEDYMRYARRVGAMDAIPKLSAMACFRGGEDRPFRMLVEGPNGYSKIADGSFLDVLLEGTLKGLRDAEDGAILPSGRCAPVEGGSE